MTNGIPCHINEPLLYIIHMSGSRPHGKQHTKAWLRSLPYKPIHALDVGTGDGKYQRLLLQVFPNRFSIEGGTTVCQSGFHIEGIEIWKPYIERFNLEQRYDEIYNIDARKFDWTGKQYDVVFCGDVLEHMSKEDAVELVRNASLHSRHVLINIPIYHAEQGAEAGNPYETHVKPDWTHDEVMATWPMLKRIDDSGKNMHLKGVYVLNCISAVVQEMFDEDMAKKCDNIIMYGNPEGKHQQEFKT